MYGTYRTAIVRVARALDPVTFRDRRRTLIVMPPPVEGTLRYFFEPVYRTGASRQHLRDQRRTQLFLCEFVGHDLRVDNLTNFMAADFFVWLLARGQNKATVSTGDRSGELTRDPRNVGSPVASVRQPGRSLSIIAIGAM
jgi:hypothetical protein